MPVYTFRCDAGHETDIRRDPDDATRDATCDTCGKPAQRLYRLRGIGFKGRGFYTTDYPRGRRLAD